LSILFLLSAPARLEAQSLGHWQGWCELGGLRDAALDNFVQASYPSCTVDVYFTGTTTHATIYSDINSTPLSNPFAAAANGSVEFYAAQGQQYDVVTSGAGMPASFTYPYVGTSGSGGILSSPASPQTITGQMLTLTTSAPLMVDGATLLTETSTKSLNKIEFADRFAGRDACAKIHAAISALPAGGGTVDARGFQGSQACASDPFAGGTTAPVQLLLGAANFEVTAQWQVSAGTRITCLDPAVSTITGVSTTTTMVVIQSDTTVENCHIIGGLLGLGSRVTVRGNIIEGSPRGPNVNAADSPTYWLVQGNIIRNGGNEGVLFNATHNGVPDDPNCPSTANCGLNQVLDNWIYGNQKNGIDIASSRNTIRGNHVFMNGGTGHTESGLDQFGILLFAAVGPPSETPTSHNIVSQNEIFSNNTFGIALVASQGGGTVSYNIVTDNSVRYNGTTASGGVADGIFLIAYENGNVINNLISNNFVIGNTRNGIYLNFPVAGPGTMSNNQIIGNQLLDNASYGFLSDGGGGAVSGNYVVNNIAQGNGVGQIGDGGSIAATYSNQTSTTALLDVATHGKGNIIPVSIFTVTMTGIGNDAGGFKHARFGSTCTAAPKDFCASVYHWTTAFADVDYTVSCSLAGTIAGRPVISSISAKQPFGITMILASLSDEAASASEVDCIAVHD